jgi:hypothetical protein
MEDACRLAVQSHYGEVLHAQIERWEEIRRVRYAAELEQRIEAVGASEPGQARVEAAREWLTWITAYVDGETPSARCPGCRSAR